MLSKRINSSGKLSTLKTGKPEIPWDWESPILKTFFETAFGYDSIFDRAFNGIPSTPPSSYPPYDIVKEHNKIILSMAVAGFKKEDLQVYLSEDGEKLIIEGEKKDKLTESDTRKIIAKNIGQRNFRKYFSVSTLIEVESVKLEDGVLTITLYEKEPEPPNVKTFEIE